MQTVIGVECMDISSIIDQIEQQLREQDALYHNVATRYGLSDTALWVLYILNAAEGDCTQQDLIRKCSAPKQTVNSAVASLAKKGFLTLEMIPGTRNLKRILPTEEGRTLLQHCVQPMQQAELRAFAQLSEEELRLYLELTRRITSNLRKEIETL